jgi:hypothetical protein
MYAPCKDVAERRMAAHWAVRQTVGRVERRLRHLAADIERMLENGYSLHLAPLADDIKECQSLLRQATLELETSGIQETLDCDRRSTI